MAAAQGSDISLIECHEAECGWPLSIAATMIGYAAGQSIQVSAAHVLTLLIDLHNFFCGPAILMPQAVQTADLVVYMCWDAHIDVAVAVQCQIVCCFNILHGMD